MWLRGVWRELRHFEWRIVSSTTDPGNRIDSRKATSGSRGIGNSNKSHGIGNTRRRGIDNKSCGMGNKNNKEDVVELTTRAVESAANESELNVTRAAESAITRGRGIDKQQE